MTKKFIAFIMSVVMLCSMCSFGVFGNSDSELPNISAYADNTTSGTAVEEPTGDGTDIVVCIDLSTSLDDEMLAIEKSEVKKYINSKLHGESRVAIVSFGSPAEVEMAFSNDKDIIFNCIDSLSANKDSTGIADALANAIECIEADNYNKSKEVYLISDGFPVSTLISTDTRYQNTENKFDYAPSYYEDPYGMLWSISSSAANLSYSIAKIMHAYNWTVETKGIYKDELPANVYNFAEDFMSSLANPPGNYNISYFEDYTEETTEEYIETTTESGGKSSNKAQFGGGGSVETDTEATTSDSSGIAEEPEEIYEYGALANLPLIETYNINSQSAAVNAVNDIVARIEADRSIDINDTDVKDELANFADEAIGLSAQATLGSDGEIDAAAISALADTALSTKTAVEKALSDSGVTLDRELLTAVTFNSDGAIQLAADVTSIPVDNLHIDVPGGGRITLGSQFVEENATDEPIIVSLEIEGAEIEEEAVETEAADDEPASQGGTLVLDATAEGGTRIIPNQTEDEVAAANSSSARFTINVISPKITPVCSIPAIGGVTTDYQGVKGSDGMAVSKPNNSTRKIQFRPTSSGQYTVTNVTQLDFTDVSSLSGTQRDTLRKLYAHGLVEGKTATTFAPQTTLTRAEFTTLLLKTIGAYDPNYSGTSGFRDMSGVWSEPIVARAKGLGIIAGYDSDNTFRPDNKLNNEQLYHMLGITYGKVNSRASNITSSQVSSEISKFADSANIGQWARQNIAVSTLSGFYTANTGGNFNPRNEVTRFNAALSINRLFERAPFEGRWS